MNPESLERANAFLAAVASRTSVGGVMEETPAEIGREIGLPDALSAARAVRALIARRRLEPAQGSYRLLEVRPVDPGEREVVERPRRRRPARREQQAPRPSDGKPTYSEVGREMVEKLIELGRENAALRASARQAREEAREAREARIEAEHRAETLAAKVHDLEARAEMAEANLRALLAAAKGAGRAEREPVSDTEMEAILGVLKRGDEVPTS